MNDGKRKRYRIADAEIEIAFTENYTEIICRDYEVKAEGKPDFVIEVTDEEVEREKRKVNRGHQKELLSHWQFTENCVKKYWTEIVSCFIALLLLWMEKHTCLRLQAEQENPRIQGCGDSISAAGQ